jgi:hypothetical protein
MSNLPLTITTVGVGNANFDTMNSFDNLKGRIIDNFQFTAMNDALCDSREKTQKKLWHMSLMEVPEHHRKCVEKLGYKDPINEDRIELELKAIQKPSPLKYIPVNPPAYNPQIFQNPPPYKP